MFHYSNGKNIEALQQSKRHADSQALTRSTAKKNYAKGIDALCTDWSAKTMKGWTDKDKLRCAAIENVIKKDGLKIYHNLMRKNIFRQFIVVINSRTILILYMLILAIYPP